METIVVKLLDNPENPKLKMKYIGAIDYATPKIGPDGKIRTGLDENALDIITIADPKQKKKIQDQVQKEREELERLLGVELGPHSSFWDKYYVPLSDEEFSLDPSNPADRVKEKFLVANRYVAPSKDAIDNDPDYLNCIFYLYRETEETTKKAVDQKSNDKAKSKLYLLNEDNPNKLKTVASYIFGFNADSDISVETAYVKLSDYIENSDKEIRKKNIKFFLEVVEMTQEQMHTKLILDKAIKKRIVTQRNGIYRRGDQILGNSYDEAVSNLNSVEKNGELASLIKEVNKVE